MLLVSFISYVDRNTLALLSPTILEETGLTAEQYGYIISAFSIAYMLGNPLWGRALDRWGLRLGMTLSVTLWTIASVSHAFVGSLGGFATARAALGFGEGATFPGGLRAAVQTLPPSKQSRGIAVSYSGGSLGAIIAPLVVTPIALLWGWRSAFLFTGAIGAAWLALWSVISRRPDIRRLPAPVESEPSEKRMSVRDPRIWSFGILYALGALPIAFVIYSSPIYLSRALGASQALIGEVLWLPPLGWEIGYFFWGWLADRAKAASEDRLPALRRLLLIATLLGLPLAAVPGLASFPLAMAVFVLAMFCAAGFIILSIAYATDIYSSRYAGLISGLSSGAWSAAVAVIMPIFGHLFDGQAYGTAFLLAAACPVAALLVWRALSSASGRP